MSAPEKKKSKTANPLSESFDMGSFGMQGFDMPPELLAAPSSLSFAPPPPSSLQQSFSMMQNEMAPFLRDFDELYPTPISLSSVAGVATASAASAPQDQHAAPKLMEEDHGNLDALKKTYRNISASMESLEWELKNFISLSPAEHQALTVKLNERVTDLTNLRKSAGQLLSTILLIPPQFEMWKWLLTHVEQALQQLQVYKKELDAVFHNKYPAQGFGSLVITEQPFPDVVKQKEKKRSKGHAGHHEGHLEVKVLTGARSSIILVSKDVTAELIWENEKDQKAKGSSSILNPTAPVKKGSGAARFDEIRFSKGTGVKIVNLQFSCMAKAPPSLEIPGAGGEFRLTSNLSQPFIVMTNESQFSDSAEKLLEQEAFGKRNSVAWLRFANLLQLHYLIATRQALNKIERPLTKTDLGYIWQLRFNRAKEVTRDAVQEFWKWFGKVLHILRHQKPVPELWSQGLIFGFISKEAAQDLLRGRPVGTFLIRFSEQSAGQFAVACVAKGKKAGENVIKHHLVPISTKKLSDYIMSKESFSSVLLCNSEFRVETFAAMVKGTMSKDGAFGEYVAKKESGAGRMEGYDDLGGDDEDEEDEEE